MPSVHLQLGHGVSLRVACRRPSKLIHVHAGVLQRILNAFCIFQSRGIAKRRLPEAASGPVLGPFCLPCGFHYKKKKQEVGIVAHLFLKVTFQVGFTTFVFM